LFLTFSTIRSAFLTLSLALFVGVLAPVGAQAQVTAFRQAVAEASSRDTVLAGFYRSRDFEGIWTGSDSVAQARRNALLSAFASAADHGLPAAKYNVDTLIAELTAAQTAHDKGLMEVELTRLFLTYARQIQSGILVPSEVDDGIHVVPPLRDPLETLTGFLAAEPVAFIRALAPATPEYQRLMREKLRMESVVAAGGWGPTVRAERLELGDSGDQVIALRNRLVAMGYMDRSATRTFDAAIFGGVQRFQQTHGLEPDGVAGASTIQEVNVPAEDRLKSIIVAMERERWLNLPGGRGERYIWVNLTDFTAAIVDNERVTFATRSVIGANSYDRQSPEFSDEMTHMIVNPSWYVPRSIAVKEYLPRLAADPTAVSHLLITNAQGQTVDRSTADFSQYTATNFPFDLRQPPGARNALGEVKFMFPNRYNIYLHDTPQRSLFGRESRAFSHGCIRLNDPRDFAYALLARQTSDPVGEYRRALNVGQEVHIDLVQHVPVHLVYRTAFTLVTGSLQFRRDVYGRDAEAWDALVREGVAAAGVQG